MEKNPKIFQKYISKFFCLKTQYSGLKNVKHSIEDAKKKLSEELLTNFEILVKWEDIPSDKNDAMRYVMKLILNSLWGKLCQNPNKSDVYFVNDYEELSYVLDNKYKSVYFDVLNGNVARVICNYKEEHNYKVNKVCVAIGSYITCYSRLKLLESLNKLPPKSVLYYDTNSIIYYSEHCDEILDTGLNLGDLASELKENEHITSFVSTALKSYSYITNTGNEITHVKGFKIEKKQWQKQFES